jgi:hypothetical protein
MLKKISNINKKLKPVGNSELAVPHGPGEIGVCQGENCFHVAGVKTIRAFLKNPSET